MRSVRSCIHRYVMALSAHSAMSFSISAVQPLLNFFLDFSVPGGGADEDRLEGVSAAAALAPGVGDNMMVVDSRTSTRVR